MFFILTRLICEDSLEIFFYSSIFCIIIIAVIGLIIEKDIINGRLVYLYKNPNLLADLLAFASMICILVLKKSRFNYLLAVLLIVFLILTKSLGAVAAFAAAALFVVIIKHRFVMNFKTISIICGLAIIIASIYFYRETRLATDPFGHKRLEILNSGLKSASDSYLFGAGHNTIELKLKRYAFPVVNSEMKYIKKPDNPHNIFLHIFNETGAINVVLFFLFIIMLGVESYNNNIRFDNRVLFGTTRVIIFLLHHSSDVGYVIPIHNYFFALFIILITQKSRFYKLPEFSALAKLIIAFGILVIIIFVPATHIYSEWLATQGIKLQESGQFKAAAAKFEKSLVFRPERSEIQQRLGGCYRDMYFSTGDCDYMIKCLKRMRAGAALSQLNGLFKINIAKTFYDFYGESAKNSIKLYIMESLNAEPYNAPLYADAVELLFKLNLKNDALQYAKLGLICEPYFLRLRMLSEKIAPDNSGWQTIAINNIRYISAKRAEFYNFTPLRKTSDAGEIYYYEIMYKQE